MMVNMILNRISIPSGKLTLVWKITIFPTTYHQHGGCSMATLLDRTVNGIVLGEFWIIWTSFDTPACPKKISRPHSTHPHTPSTTDVHRAWRSSHSLRSTRDSPKKSSHQGELSVSFKELIPRHPAIFSDDDWGVQSPSKRIVFRFHYHSQFR